ncbi:hypothetical protein GCM10010330_76920 [Streptomyces tendae]|nr:hypothetical protein GCM10010330_76920 [Streptomyces tendae]
MLAEDELTVLGDGRRRGELTHGEQLLDWGICEDAVHGCRCGHAKRGGLEERPRGWWGPYTQSRVHV